MKRSSHLDHVVAAAGAADRLILDKAPRPDDPPRLLASAALARGDLRHREVEALYQAKQADNIPATDIAQIEVALRKHRIPITVDTVRGLYRRGEGMQ